MWGLVVEFSDVYSQLPVGRRREVVGATPAIRLLRPLVTLPDFPEKSSVITTLFKISDISNEICDILKTALAS